LSRRRSVCYTIGSLGKPRRRHRGQRRLKMILYLTHESRGTLKSFTLFITARAITNMNLGHIDKFEIKISRRDSCSLDNLECRHLQRTAKKCTKVYNARAQPLFSSLNLCCFRRGFPKLPTFSSRWFSIFSCSSHNLRFPTRIFRNKRKSRLLGEYFQTKKKDGPCLTKGILQAGSYVQVDLFLSL